MHRVFFLVPFFLLGCATWRGRVEEHGFTLRELGCAKTFIVGGTPGTNRPLLPMSSGDIKRVERLIERNIPELRRASSESDADVIVSVLFVDSSPVCLECEPEPPTEWSALLVPGKRQTSLEFLNFDGHIVVGISPQRAFVRQLRDTIRGHPCGEVPPPGK